MRHYQHAPPDKMKKGYDFSSVVFMPKKKNFNLITRINHINTNWRTFSKITDQDSSKLSWSRKKDWGTVPHYRRNITTKCNKWYLIASSIRNEYQRENWWNVNKVCLLVNNTVLVNFLVLIIVLWLSKILAFGEDRLSVETTFVFPCNLSKDWNYFTVEKERNTN